MSQNKSPEKYYIGADVSKQTVDFFNSETGEYNTVSNDKAALKRFFKTLKDPAIVFLKQQTVMNASSAHFLRHSLTSKDCVFTLLASNLLRVPWVARQRPIKLMRICWQWRQKP